MVKAVFCAALFAAATAASFTENFSGDWESRWVPSKAKSDLGKWDVSAGAFFADAEASKGLRTTEDARFYAIGTKFPAPVDGTAEDSKLVVQLSVKHEQGIDCGGGYLKLMKSTADLENFNGDTEYNIMFGPDHCGPPKKMIHIIFNHEGKNLLWKKEVKAPDDKLTHVYTLIVDSKAQTYELLLDGESKMTGTLEADWDFLAPKEIDDPTDSKPADWVDSPEMDDPEDVKPADYDSIPAQIADPEATKPEDWDEEEDGAWEAPQIPNPEYKGAWSPKRIPNPAYKGVWAAKRIPNPEYVANDKLATYTDNGALGFDLWQVKSGTIFDNIYVGNSVEEAQKLAKAVLDLADKEKAAKDKIDEDARIASEAAAEAAAPKAADVDEKRVLTIDDMKNRSLITWRGMSQAEKDFLQHLIKEGKVKAVGQVSKRVQRGDHVANLPASVQKMLKKSGGK